MFHRNYEKVWVIGEASARLMSICELLKTVLRTSTRLLTGSEMKHPDVSWEYLANKEYMKMIYTQLDRNEMPALDIIRVLPEVMQLMRHKQSDFAKKNSSIVGRAQFWRNLLFLWVFFLMDLNAFPWQIMLAVRIISLTGVDTPLIVQKCKIDGTEFGIILPKKLSSNLDKLKWLSKKPFKEDAETPDLMGFRLVLEYIQKISNECICVLGSAQDDPFQDASFQNYTNFDTSMDGHAHQVLTEDLCDDVTCIFHESPTITTNSKRNKQSKFRTASLSVADADGVITRLDAGGCREMFLRMFATRNWKIDKMLELMDQHVHIKKSNLEVDLLALIRKIFREINVMDHKLDLEQQYLEWYTDHEPMIFPRQCVWNFAPHGTTSVHRWSHTLDTVDTSVSELPHTPIPGCYVVAHCTHTGNQLYMETVF